MPDNMYIPSVNDQVSKLLQTYAVKIHLIAELLSINYKPLNSIQKRYINYTIIEYILDDIVIKTKNLNWRDFLKTYMQKKENLKNKIYNLLTSMRDSRIGIPILTELSKEAFKSEELIKRYLPLYIIEEVYNSWTDDKRKKVPKELFKRYSQFLNEGKENEFEELASRLFNKVFFSSIIVNKIGEELEYRLVNPDTENLKKYNEYKNYLSYPQIFFIYIDEMGSHSSNPYSYYVAIKRDELFEIQPAPFRTHLLVQSFIINNCNNDNFIIYTFNTIPDLVKKIEEALTRKHKSIFKKIYKL